MLSWLFEVSSIPLARCARTELRPGYYLKIFPDVPQKAASGFLTTLWSKDPFRNKWALIAKVYSFVRDEVGKEKVSLSFFLRVCCPTMKIIEPSEYLAMLGWSIRRDETGIDKLFQDARSAAQVLDKLSSDTFPDTEMELLTSLLHIGYLPEDGHLLLGRLNTNSNGLMTTTSGSPEIKPLQRTNPKNDFIHYVRDSPLQAAKDLYGSDYDEGAFRQMGVAFHEVKNVGAYLPTRFEWPDTRPPYTYSTNSSHLYNEPCGVLQLESVAKTETFDIDNPWDVDTLLGHEEQEGVRSKSPSPFRRHNANKPKLLEDHRIDRTMFIKTITSYSSLF